MARVDLLHEDPKRAQAQISVDRARDHEIESRSNRINAGRNDGEEACGVISEPLPGL
jgi:hypothetical protein